ncbi:MAG: flippase [Patescibacteria group bacterium]
MTLSHKIAFNTFVQIAGKALSTTLGVLITIVLTRYLGPVGFGTFTFAIVFVTMFGTLADWGMTLITVREASKNQKDANIIIGNVLVLRLIFAAFAATVAILVINFLPYPSEQKLLVSIAAAFLLALSIKTSFQIVFMIKLKMENWALSELGANGLSIILILFLVSYQASLPAIITALTIGHFFSAALAILLGWRLLPLKLSLWTKYSRHLLVESVPMGAILVLFTVYNRLDIIIISLIKGPEAVGLYGAAYRIYEVLIVIAAYFANSIFPLISNYAVTNREKLREIFRKSYVVLFLLGVTVALINFIFAPLGIAIIAGPKFAASVLPLQILSLALVVSYFNHLNGYTLIALGKQWTSFYIAIFALVINLILNIIFIPIFSYPAAAFITFITESIVVLLSLSIIRKEI